MPTATSTVFAVHLLCWWDTGCGGNGYPEKDIQTPRNKVAVALIQDIHILQDYDFHHFGTGQTPVHPGVQVAGAQDRRTAPTVGGWCRDQPIQIGAPGEPQT